MNPNKMIEKLGFDKKLTAGLQSYLETIGVRLELIHKELIRHRIAKYGLPQHSKEFEAQVEKEIKRQEE